VAQTAAGAAAGAPAGADEPSAAMKMLDPLLQLIIMILSAICYLLVRKIQSLLADIRALED
jgi:hypothetical protein